MPDSKQDKKPAAAAPKKKAAVAATQSKPVATAVPPKPAAKAAKKPASKPAAKKVASKAGIKSGNADQPMASAQVASSKEKGKANKPKKAKLVRDSFTMPDNEYQVIGDLKKACLKAGFAVKKSELLRIGVALLQKMNTPQLQEALLALPPLKAGRPKKEARAE